MKTWVAGAVVAILAIGAGGWFLLVSPKHSDAASLREQADTKARANALLQTQLATLKAQAKDLPKQQAKLAAVAAKIPSNSAMPTLVRSLNSAAEDTGVELVSITPQNPAPVVAAPATTGTAASAATAATAASGTASAPVATGSNLQQISVSLNVIGSYFQVAEFLDRLERLQRAFRVTTLNMAPGANPVKPAASQASQDSGKVLSTNIIGLVFEAPSVAAPATAGK